MVPPDKSTIIIDETNDRAAVFNRYFNFKAKVMELPVIGRQ